jgi:hypothetical protein
MKLLLENWRRYQGEHDFNVLCENHTRGLITDTELVMLWENQVNNELDLLLSEGEILDAISIGYEKGKQLVGKAADKWNAGIEAWATWEANLLNQAFELAIRVSETSALEKAAAVLKKVLSTIDKFCEAHPTICKVVKFVLMMMIISAVISYFSSEAQAAVEVTKFDGSPLILDDRGLTAMKGVMKMMNDGASPEQQQATVEAMQWLDVAHSAETTVELAKASGDGAQIAQSVFKHMLEMLKTSEIRNLDGLVSIGEKVMIKTNTVTREVMTAKGTQVTNIEWQSLVTK